MDVSIVIRAYNEADQLDHLLRLIEKQLHDGRIEIIVVDNGSTDDTGRVAKDHNAKVVNLLQENFSYPKSLNIGVAAARFPVVISTVAHAAPVGRDWVSCAVRHFKDRQVAGVFSYALANKDGSFYDKLLEVGYWYSKLRGVVSVRRAHMGVMGANNMALRRSLWVEHQFDEQYGAGGEDTAWAAWALSQGKKIVQDPDFAIRHSHYLKTFRQFLAQVKLWDSLKKPREFKASELNFRRLR